MKANKCCSCGSGLRFDEIIYADSNGIPTVYGKPWCSDCLSESSKTEEEIEIESDDD